MYTMFFQDYIGGYAFDTHIQHISLPKGGVYPKNAQSFHGNPSPFSPFLAGLTVAIRRFSQNISEKK